MDINIRLSKNFTTAYNKLQAEFGEEFAKLNGFADEQLSYTDFIDNFIDSETVADISVDGNANVGNKDMRTLMNEMPKSHRKLLAYNKIYYELNKKYGFKTANEWLRNEWTKALYMHDADTSTYVHYCYKPEEMLTVRYNNEFYHLTFAELYNLVDGEKFDDSINQNAKFPKDLFVLDNVNEEAVWTKVTRVVQHNNSKPMRFIKYANGVSQIVTEDHPIITENGDVPAIEVTTEDRVFTTDELYFNGVNCPEQESWHTKEFGWLVGMCLAEASAQPSVVSLKQTEEEQYIKILNILNKYNMPYSIDNDSRIRIRSSYYEKILENMLIGKTAAYKALPIDYISYPDTFMDGVVAGLIDGDGTIGGYKNRQCQIRVASEELCHQISHYLKKHNVFCGDRTPYLYKSKYSFGQKLPLFGIAFTLTNENYFLNIDSIKINNKYEPRSRKNGDFKNKKYQYRYGWVNIIENSEYIDDCPIVYDITTETGHFICNNVLSHNCFAYDLKDLAEKGLFFLNNFNAEPPKHLSTFVDFVKEFISFASNRSSGAVGLPNLIPYMYYFWKEDCKNGYATKSPDYYAKQQIQRFIYAVNQPYVRDGMQSAFTNVSVFDEPYLVALFGGAEFPDGSFMLDYIEDIKEFQKLFMEEVAEIRNHNMFTFPVLSMSLLRQNGEFKDKDFAIWCVQHNMKWNDSNFFIDDSVTSLSNCCRLKNNIDDLGYFNSIGGTALKVGSVKVSTINLARIALEHPGNEQAYLVALRDLVELNCKALDVIRRIIQRNVEKGLLPNFSKGLVDFEHLYNTVGFIGVYETMKSFGYVTTDEFGYSYYTPEASAFGKKIFEVIHRTKDQFALDKDYKINCEQIPKHHWECVA